MKITVLSLRNKEIAIIDLPQNATLGTLKKEFKNVKRTGIERQAFYSITGTVNIYIYICVPIFYMCYGDDCCV